MRRIELGDGVAYQDRRWGWSLIFFCVIPLWLLLLAESLARHDTKAAWATAGSALTTAVASFALLRTNTFVIDRRSGALIHVRHYFVWVTRRTYRLSGVKAVRLGARTLEHALSPGGSVGWTETVYRIAVETDQGRLPIRHELSGDVGRRLASRLAEDLRVRIRHQPD